MLKTIECQTSPRCLLNRNNYTLLEPRMKGNLAALETNLQFAEIAVSDSMRHAPQGTNGCRENSTEGIATAENGACK
jgi:hypothetical protein